jgi:hypothetical protein
MKKHATCLWIMVLVAIAMLASAGATPLNQETDHSAILRTFEKEHPSLAEGVPVGQIPTEMREKIRQFEEKYPRLSKAFRSEKLSRQLFRETAIGLRDGNAGTVNLVSRYERHSLTIKQFKKLANRLITPQGEIRIQCANCSTMADIYYAGCMIGSSDAWYCLLRTEQYECACQNALCGGGRDCGFLL